MLSTSKVVFVLASVTTANQGFLGERELGLLQDGAVFLLMSRAAVVDFPALVREVTSGRIKAGIDVFPEEPVPADAPVRSAGDGAAARRTAPAACRKPCGSSAA